jgi:hypothetical protein
MKNVEKILITNSRKYGVLVLVFLDPMLSTNETINVIKNRTKRSNKIPEPALNASADVVAAIDQLMAAKIANVTLMFLKFIETISLDLGPITK